jgi:hypothetical protein
MLRQLLGSIVSLLSPLSIESLSKLLHGTKQQVDWTLKSLYAILDIPKDKTARFVSTTLHSKIFSSTTTGVRIKLLGGREASTSDPSR